MTPDDLRSRLALAFPAELPPPDLVARAEHTARRLRRRRTAAVAVAAVLTVAIPLSAAALARPDGAVTPAGVSDIACRWDPAVLPDQGVASTAADAAAWGFRGDESLRTRAAVLARTEARAQAGTLAAAGARVLYAGTVDDATVVVYALQPFAPDGDWAAGALAAGPDGKVFSAAGASLAEPGPRAAVSVLVPWPRRPAPPETFPYGTKYTTNLLVVLAPEGSAAIDYRGCRNGTTFTTRGDGDVLVRDVGTLDAPGRLAVRTAAGGSGYVGPVADLPFPAGRRPGVALPPVEPVDLPAGLRPAFRVVGQGGEPTEKAASEDRATVFVRCRRLEGTGPVEVFSDDRRLGAARCDGSTELIAENVPTGGWFGMGQPYDAGTEWPLVSYQLVVAVPR